MKNIVGKRNRKSPLGGFRGVFFAVKDFGSPTTILLLPIFSLILQRYPSGYVFGIKVILLKNKIEIVMKAVNGGYWNTRKEKLLRKFDGLTNKDLDFKLGEEKNMLDVLSLKLGKSKQELLSLIITL